MKRLIIIFLLLLPFEIYPISFQQLGCGISESIGDDVLERKIALSRAIKNSFSSLLENILGEDLFLEIKDDLLRDMISQPEKYLEEYVIKEETRMNGGGYIVCILGSFNRKAIYRDLSSKGLVKGLGEVRTATFHFKNLRKYRDFKRLRRMILALEGVDACYMKRLSNFSGEIVAVIRIDESRFFKLLENILEKLSIPYSTTNGTLTIEFSTSVDRGEL